VFGPAAFDPLDAEPVTITNLNASVGLAYVSGMVTETNTKTGEVVRLPFVNSDMRFMPGVFRGTDGKVHPGALRLLMSFCPVRAIRFMTSIRVHFLPSTVLDHRDSNCWGRRAEKEVHPSKRPM
jgi:hypothetical protein